MNYNINLLLNERFFVRRQIQCKGFLLRADFNRSMGYRQDDYMGEFKRGEAPSLKYHFPLSFEGEGDKGGEVINFLKMVAGMTPVADSGGTVL